MVFPLFFCLNLRKSCKVLLYSIIKGKWHYLYRAINADGLTLDIWLRKKRDTQAAYALSQEIS